MNFIYNLGAEFLGTLGTLYNFFFEQTLGSYLGVDRPWWQQNTFQSALVIVGEIFPQIGVSYELTIAQALIGYGLFSILIFRFYKFFVGIVTGS